MQVGDNSCKSASVRVGGSFLERRFRFNLASFQVFERVKLCSRARLGFLREKGIRAVNLILAGRLPVRCHFVKCHFHIRPLSPYPEAPAQKNGGPRHSDYF